MAIILGLGLSNKPFVKCRSCACMACLVHLDMPVLSASCHTEHLCTSPVPLEDAEKPSHLWAAVRMNVINLFLVSTVKSLLHVSECDLTVTPPIMDKVPLVTCDGGLYALALAFALTVGIAYSSYVALLILSSVHSFNTIAQPLWGPSLVQYSMLQGPPTLRIELRANETAALSQELKSALLDAAQVQCQQTLAGAQNLPESMVSRFRSTFLNFVSWGLSSWDNTLPGKNLHLRFRVQSRGADSR